MKGRAGFPWGLTLATAIVVAICSALGVWQLQRYAFKQRELARITAVENAPVRPIEAVLAKGADASFARVVASCAPSAPSRALSRITTDAQTWITRARAFCRLLSGPYDSLLVDRGFIDSSRGATTPYVIAVPAPVRVVGVLYATTDLCMHGCLDPQAKRMAPYTLVAESEAPAPPGVTPAPYPDVRDNLQYVGEYAPTWFGLAGVAACVYAAMLWRRYRPKGVDPNR
jgi:surfeit locus 1 family protein